VEGDPRDVSSPIEHVIVLMLENRSFDHMLGHLDARYAGRPFEGLSGTETIVLDPRVADSPTIPIGRATTDDAYVTDPDPGHEFADALLQMYGGAGPGLGACANNGFVCSYAAVSGVTRETAGRVVQCFDPTLVPVLSTLAREFVVCDHWFASMPGPTWPNRFFVHAATSKGLADSPTTAQIVAAQASGRFDMRTIYDSLEEAGRTWCIYHHDLPQAWALSRIRQRVANFRRFDDVDAYGRERGFAVDVATGRLPTYSFIEPRYFGIAGYPANDQHPPHDVRHGERLIATVYDALQSNPAVWDRSLFVVLYDEYGGFFDHVPPPAAVPPDEHVSDAPRFGFDRLGCRVPAVLVSPRLARGAVDQTVYDHTSLLGSAKKMFDLPAFLTRRDAAAQTFEHHLSNAPRPIEETPRNLLGLVPAGATTGANHHRPVASYQRQLLALMSLGPHGNEDEAARSLREYIVQASEGVQSP